MDNIWDQPVEELADEPSTNVHMSNKRPRQALFLVDSDNEESPENAQKAPDFDINAIFADVENDDDLFNFEPLAPSLDTEALKRDAEARHKNDMIALTPHAISGSSPPRDLGERGKGDLTATKTEKGKAEGKERRKPVRLDEGRLLGPNGFPQLIKETKNFKSKGKGHEATDLNRLLQIYGYWTHALYPKTVFRDTVERVEKLCHSKRMNVALSVWRDEARGLTDQKSQNDEIIDLTDHEARLHRSRISSPISLQETAYTSSPSRQPSQPISGTELEDSDDFDIDAIIREEEARMAKLKEADVFVDTCDTQTNSKNENEKGSIVVEDDEMVWEGMSVIQNSSTGVSKQPAINQTSEDEDMWDVVKEVEATMTGSSVATTATTANETSIDDEWESMYI